MSNCYMIIRYLWWEGKFVTKTTVNSCFVNLNFLFCWDKCPRIQLLNFKKKSAKWFFSLGLEQEDKRVGTRMNSTSFYEQF